MAAGIFESTTKVDFGYAPVSVIEQFQRFRGGRATEQALRELLDRAKRRSNVFGFLPLRSGRRWFERLSNKNAHEVNTVLSELDRLRDAYRLVDRASVIELLLRTEDEREGESTADCEEYVQMCTDTDGDADADAQNERASNTTPENELGNSEVQQGNESESVKMRFGDEEDDDEDERGELVLVTRGENEKATQTELAIATMLAPATAAGSAQNTSWSTDRLSAANAHALSPFGTSSNAATLGAATTSQTASAAAGPLYQQAAAACAAAGSSGTPSGANSPSVLELLALLNNIASQRIAPQLLSHAAVNTYALKQQLEQNALLSFLLTQSTLMLSAPFLDLNSLTTSTHCCPPLAATSPPGVCSVSVGASVPNAHTASGGSTLLRPARPAGNDALLTAVTNEESSLLRAANASPGTSRAVVSSSTELPGHGHSQSLSVCSYDDSPQPVGVGFMTRFRVQAQHSSPSTNKRKLTQPKLASTTFGPQQSTALNLSTKLEHSETVSIGNEEESQANTETDSTRRPISSRTLKALKAKRLRNAVSSMSTLASTSIDANTDPENDADTVAKRQQATLMRNRFAQPDVGVTDVSLLSSVKVSALATGSSVCSRLSASPNASGSDAPPASASGMSQKRGASALRRGAAATADGERLRLFRCQVCSRSFYRKDHLRQHLTIHTTDKPIKCPIADCSYSCGQRNSLNWHLRTKHPQAFSQLAVLKHSSLDAGASTNVLAPGCAEPGASLLDR